MSKKAETKYEIRYETWDWNEDEENYTDGPFYERNISVDTLKEAREYIREFKSEHPGSYKGRIQYDEVNPYLGILYQKCICDQLWDFIDETTGEKRQLEFNVFKVVYSKEE